MTRPVVCGTAMMRLRRPLPSFRNSTWGRCAYLAGRYSRREELLRYAADLARIRIEVRARWLLGLLQYGADGDRAQFDLGQDAEMASRFASEDVEDLIHADIVISFTEEPRKPSINRGGRHVEHGMALALQKRVLVVGHRENAFHWLPEVEVFPTWAEALEALRP